MLKTVNFLKRTGRGLFGLLHFDHLSVHQQTLVSVLMRSWYEEELANLLCAVKQSDSADGLSVALVLNYYRLIDHLAGNTYDTPDKRWLASLLRSLSGKIITINEGRVCIHASPQSNELNVDMFFNSNLVDQFRED